MICGFRDSSQDHVAKLFESMAAHYITEGVYGAGCYFPHLKAARK